MDWPEQTVLNLHFFCRARWAFGIHFRLPHRAGWALWTNAPPSFLYGLALRVNVHVAYRAGWSFGGVFFFLVRAVRSESMFTCISCRAVWSQ